MQMTCGTCGTCGMVFPAPRGDNQKQKGNKMQSMKVEITLLEPMLGSKAANKEVFSDYIASKAPDDDLRKQELESVEHLEEAGTTVYHRDEGGLIIWDYQIKGFCKEAGDVIRQSEAEATTLDEDGKPVKKRGRKKWGAIRKKIDNFVFVYPRKIHLGVEDPEGVMERPIRVLTMQGERISVCKSEYVDDGVKFMVEFRVFGANPPVTLDMIREMLDYGQFKGLGQWRNASWGRFTWRELEHAEEE